MHPLQDHLRPLLEAEDIEGLTALLEAWQPRDAFWRQCVSSRLLAPSSTPAQKLRLQTLLSQQEDAPDPNAHSASVDDKTLLITPLPTTSAYAQPRAGVSAMTALPPYRLALLGELIDDLPAALREAHRHWFLSTGGEDEEYEEFEEEHLQSQRCICFDGDARLNSEQWSDIRREHGDGPLSLVVMGDLHFEGRGLPDFHVAGNLYCDVIRLSNEDCSAIGGRIHARHFALFSGADDETLHRGFRGRVSTPHAFFWFHDWREVALDDATVVYLVCDQHHFEEPDPPRWFAWQDELKALRPELSYRPVSWGSHELLWKLDAFGRCLAAGEPVFIEGFSPDCLPLMTHARAHLRQKQYREAFLHYKAAIAVSPRYQPAWAEAARALYLADALEQAIPYAEQAVALMPEALRHLQNEAADDLALCLLRLQRWERAIAVASDGIEYCKKESDRAVAYRVRGEARLRIGELQGARDDLLQAAGHSYRSALYQWLAGLAHFRMGEHTAAEALREKAARLDAKYARPFQGEQGSDFRYPSPANVDWEQQTLADLPTEARDSEYWRRYLQTQAYDTPKSFRAIPVEFLTREFCSEAIERSPNPTHIWVAKYFPETAFDAALAESLIERSAENLAYIPRHLVTKALLLRASTGCFDFAFVPPELLDGELCRKLAERRVPPDALPSEWLDAALCRHAVRYWSGAIEHVPGRFKDEAFYLMALAWADSTWYIRNRIPDAYLSADRLCHALEVNFDLIHRLPGRLVDETVFAHAHALCADAELWARLTAAHGREFRRHSDRGEYLSCAEDCWLVFWDEALILAEIAHQPYHLFPFDIPPAMYTQAIANAAFARDPIHLRSIPRAFITTAMAERFAREYADMLYDLPLPLRSASVCRIAADASWDHGKYFRHVPLALRSVEACVRALRQSADNAEFVPLAARHAVYDNLLGTRDKSEFAIGWLLNERGLGALAQGRIDEAIADFDCVIQRGQGSATAQRPGLLRALLGKSEPLWKAEDFNEDDVADARFYKAWACRHYGRTAALQEALAALDDEQRALLDTFALNEAPEAFEFDLARYESLIGAAGQLAQQGDARTALEAALQARALLEAAQHPDPCLWANVLDHLRFLTWELGQFEDNQRLCRELLERLGSVTDWPYLEEHNILRAARRAAHNTLAWSLAESGDQAELAQALVHARAALRRAPIEGEEVTHPFLETLARVLLRAAEHEPQRQEEAQRVLKRIAEFGLTAKDDGITDQRVRAALRALDPDK